MSEEMEEDNRPLKSNNLNQAIKEAALNDTDEETYECTEGCGRRFKAETLEKHAKICKKVFQTKRKVFDETAMRLENIVDPGQIKQIKKQKTQVEKAAVSNPQTKGASW